MTSRSPAAVGRSPYRVVDDLDRDWRVLVAADGAVPQGWAAHPALAACADLDEVVARAARGDDAVLVALLGAAAGPDALAARTVLQAMLGRLVRMAGRDPRASVDDYVGALWCVIATYPLAARPARAAANLALDTLKEVHRDRRWGRAGPAPVWLPGEALETVLEHCWQRGQLDHGRPAHELTAAAVIAAGRRLRLIDARTGALLHDVYVEGLSGREAAQRGGSTPGSARVRCSRAVRRLAAEAPALVEAA